MQDIAKHCVSNDNTINNREENFPGYKKGEITMQVPSLV
jgi:hypothetical protein